MLCALSTDSFIKSMKPISKVLLTLTATGWLAGNVLAQPLRAPLLGNLQASAHQRCGQDITLQLLKTTDNIMLMGLKNRESGETDLFMSSSPFTADNSYSRFVPVKFDQLSKHFIETHNAVLEVIWGAAKDDKNVLRYTLALGSYTYSCGAIESWPNDTANQLYGEPDSSDAGTAAEKKALRE